MKYCRNIVFNGDNWFFYLNRNLNIEKLHNITEMKILHSTKWSFIIQFNEKIALKLIKPQKYPRDVIRKYFFSQAKREIGGSCKLKELGFNCPDTIGYAISLSPIAKYESILFVEYKKGFLNGYEFLKEEKNASNRKKFLKNVADDLLKIYGSYYHKKDCRFGNLLVDDDMKPIWIDNELRKFIRRKTANKYMEHTLKRLKASSTDRLNEDEWNFLYNMLVDKF
jgi:hypothetical protein